MSGQQRRTAGAAPGRRGPAPALLLTLLALGGTSGAQQAPPSDGFLLVDDMLVPAGWFEESATGAVQLWPGVIPYGFDGSVSALNQARLLAAMDQLEAIAGVQFVPHTGEAAWVLVQSGSGNSAHLGMLGGQQSLTIASWTVHYTIVHELLHVLGFVHEHQRTDRDDFVAVQLGNVVPGVENQFAVIATSTAVGPYDLDSVMHYGQCQASVCGPGCPPGCVTLLVLPPDESWQGLIGQRDHLSVEDAAGLVEVYGSWDCNGNGVHDYADIQAGTLEDCNGNGRPDACEPPGTVADCNGNGVGDPCELASGAGSDCNGNGLPDDCDVAAGTLPDCDGNGVADLCQLLAGTASDCNGNGSLDACDVAAGTSPDRNRDGVPDECEVAAILLVDASARGAGDGSSWEDAVPRLADALAMAAAAPNVVKEVWVAAGVHTPAPPGGARTASFGLTAGVDLLGGFLGVERVADERDPLAHPTVLSGDLDGDDGAGGLQRADNVFHVVTIPVGRANGPGFVLDGFVVQAGQADGPAAADRIGAGLLVAGEATVSRCVVRDNFAVDDGGGVHTAGGRLQLVGSSLLGNRAGRGGGLFADGSEVTAVNGLLVGNRAELGDGGAVAAQDGRPFLTNVTIVGNTAAGQGGGLHLAGGQLGLTNAIVWDNADGAGRGEAAQLAGTGATLTVAHCCIAGLSGALGGAGNLAAPTDGDLLFRAGLGPDGRSGSGDEDLRLASGAIVIDAGTGLAEPAVVAPDVGGLRRFRDDPATPDSGVPDGVHAGIVDLGAWEYRCLTDVSGDGSLDAQDVDAVVRALGQTGPTGVLVAPDVNGDGIVDAWDLHVLLRGSLVGVCP